MAFFGICSAVLMAAAIGFFIPVLSEYIITAYVSKVPTLIVSTVLALASVIFFATGLILDIIIRKHRQNALIQLNCLSSERRNNK